MKDIATIAAIAAKKKGICKPWYDELKRFGNDKHAMIQMYIKGIDFCLSNDYPSNDFIRENFKGTMEDYGIFLDESVNLINYRRCVALGKTHGRVETGSYGVCEVFAKHDSELIVIAKDNAFVEIDVYDNAVLHIHATDRAKVHVKHYGGSVVADPIADGDSAIIKIIEKYKKTY